MSAIDERRMSKTRKTKTGKTKVRMSKASARKVKLRARRPKATRQSPERKLAELKRRLLEINDLWSAGAVLGWDQATHMPEGGAGARGRQSATLRRLAHERLVDPALGRLIDDLEPYA